MVISMPLTSDLWQVVVFTWLHHTVCWHV